MSFLASFWDKTLDIIFPRICFGCKKEGSFLCASCLAGLGVVPPSCFLCKKLVPGRIGTPPGRSCVSCRKNTNIYAFLSPFLYDRAIIKDMLHHFKYLRIKSLDLVLAGLILDYFTRFVIQFPKNVLMIPIPMHASRRRTRGFNQAELLALRICEEGQKLGFSFDFNNSVLSRIKNIPPQVELTGQARRNNVSGVFRVNPTGGKIPTESATRLEMRFLKEPAPYEVSEPNVVRGRNIILLDDVKTTGATLEEASRVIKEAGAKRIWAVTVAH